MAKVRAGLVHLTLDVPRVDVLMVWAGTPYKPLAGHLTFYSAKGGPVLETLSWEIGQCVGYEEEFRSGNDTQGAYVCHLVIAAPQLTLQAGAPGKYVPPVARQHGMPPLPLKWKGGAGPDGMGDTIGKFSGRRFDPDNCGGPIIKRTWQDSVIHSAGITKVQVHLSRYGEDSENQAMVQRLLKIAEGTTEATNWDKRFYTHELREYERYQAMGIADGVDPGREAWNNAHTATLEDFGLSDYSPDGTHNLYHPEI